MLTKIVLVSWVVVAAVAAAELEQPDELASSENGVLSRSTRSTCGYDSCNAFCRKLGHARGVCIGTYCQCRFRRRRSLTEAQNFENVNEAVPAPLGPVAANEDAVIDGGVSHLDELVLSRARRSCGAGECNAHCKKLGLARGVCIGTYCQCRSRRRRSVPEAQYVENVNEAVPAPLVPLAANEEAVNNDGVSHLDELVLSRSRRSCGARECNEHCKKLGHVRGVCIGTYCQCRSQ